MREDTANILSILENFTLESEEDTNVTKIRLHFQPLAGTH